MRAAVTATTVAALVADVLGISRDSVRADSEILRLPGFTSTALLRLVDRLEEGLNVEFPPDALVAATFTSPARVAEVLTGEAQ